MSKDFMRTTTVPVYLARRDERILRLLMERVPMPGDLDATEAKTCAVAGAILTIMSLTKCIWSDAKNRVERRCVVGSRTDSTEIDWEALFSDACNDDGEHNTDVALSAVHYKMLCALCELWTEWAGASVSHETMIRFALRLRSEVILETPANHLLGVVDHFGGRPRFYPLRQ